MVQKKKNHKSIRMWLVLTLVIFLIQSSTLYGRYSAPGLEEDPSLAPSSWLHPAELLKELGAPAAGVTSLHSENAFFNLGCNNEVNVPANTLCMARITADMVLEGTFPDGLTDDDFIVRVVGDDPDEDDEVEDDIANAVGRFIVEVSPRNPSNFPFRDWDGCWGYINVEDKKPPRLVGEYEEELNKVLRNVPTQAREGTIGETANDGEIDISEYSCMTEDEAFDPCERPYRIITFRVNRDDIYTLDLRFDDDEKGLLALFRESFNPENPCERIFSQTNGRRELQGAPPLPEGESGPIHLVVPLEANQTYVALISLQDCSEDLDGNAGYSLSIYSENGGRATSGFNIRRDLEVCLDLLCSDVDFVRNEESVVSLLVGDDRLGSPVFEDCTLERVWFEDGQVVENGDCGEIYFLRSWYAIDANQRRLGPEIQKISFRRPTLADIYRPAKTVPIECNGPWSQCLNGEDYPLPLITGYPYIVSAFGIHDINETYCNLGASYDDISNINICENTEKIVRQWTLINWCDVGDQDDLNNGTLVNYRQIIKIGDFTPPEVNEMDDMVISSNVFNCEANLVIPMPDVTEDCTDCDIVAAVYQLVDDPVYNQYGQPTGETRLVEREIYRGEPGDVVPGLQQEYQYKIIYDVRDQCGNRAAPVELSFTIEDEVKPVAICDDDLHISIGGGGIAFINARDVDEGSNDNCGDVSVYVSRKIGSQDILDLYLEEVFGLTSTDIFSAIIDGPEGNSIQIIRRKGDNEILFYRKGGMWYTWWNERVAFICIDKGGEVTIELLAVDGDGTLESYLSGEANAGLCWLDVLIEDKIPPLCEPPADVDIDCTALPFDFDPEDDTQLAALFGEATGTDDCGEVTTRQVSKTVDWECNSGVITRAFQAIGSQGQTSVNSCVQTITVDAVHDYEIRFPKDAVFNCEPPDADTIEITENACDIIMVNVHDETFRVATGDDACYKIERTYRVINWCEYTGEEDPVVISRNADCDNQMGEEDVYVIVRPNGVAYVDRDNNENSNPFRSPCNNGATGHYDNSNLNSDLESRGHWQYTQIIKIYDDTPPEIRMRGETEFCSINSDCTADVDLELGIADLCTFDNVETEFFLIPDPELELRPRIDLQDDFFRELFSFRLTGEYPNYTASGRFPIGEHQLEVRVEDGCGNRSQKTFAFTVIDCKAPQPVCINGLAIGLMPTEPNTDVDGDGDIDLGAVDIWASDFKVSGLDDCSEPVKLSINRVGQQPDPTQDELILTCDDPDTLAVEIWAWDAAFNPRSIQPDGTVGGPNYGRCITYIILQDEDFNLCDPPGPGNIEVSGLVTTEEDEMVEQAEIRLSGKMNEISVTAADGSFSFRNLPMGYDYSITPFKEDNYLNGVSTFDLVLITKHILGKSALDSPYKLIAADVNNSGSISTIDLIQLRKLILGIRNELPDNDSWRFVPATYTFPDPSDPWREAFPELINYNDLDRDMVTGDFIAIKIGDVSNNAVANSRSGTVRSVAGTFYLQTAEQELIAGNQYRVTLSAEELSEIQGCQFTLEFDARKMELVDVEYGVATADNLGMTYVEDGLITLSWNQGAAPAQQKDFCTMIFQTKTDGYLSHLLSLGSRYTPAEAYDQSDDIMDVNLRFIEGQETAASFELYQNRPNPFGESTVIEFYLPEEREATLTLHSVNGEVLKVINGTYPAGRTQLTINRKDLFQSGISAGVLYYTLNTGGQTATKKMVMLE